MAELVSTARGWHGVQLAVLAFIGLCGVLSDSDPADPRWLDVTAGLLAVVALVLACLAVFLVATVAWPLRVDASDPDDAGSVAPPGVARASSRLRAGVTLTFVAVAVMALAASSSWWPTGAGDQPSETRAVGIDVGIIDAQGRVWCGELLDAPTGAIRLATASGTIELEVTRLAGIRPVDGC